MKPSHSPHIYLWVMDSLLLYKWEMIPYLVLIAGQQADEFLNHWLDMLGWACGTQGGLCNVFFQTQPPKYRWEKTLSFTSILGVYCLDYKWVISQRGKVSLTYVFAVEHTFFFVANESVIRTRLFSLCTWFIMAHCCLKVCLRGFVGALYNLKCSGASLAPHVLETRRANRSRCHSNNSIKWVVLFLFSSCHIKRIKKNKSRSSLCTLLNKTQYIAVWRGLN